ncbi:MAG: hypothetical protein QM817_10300 [Archangium sp.]
MALLNQTTGTLVDLLKLMNEGSPVRRVAELATRDSELLQHLPMGEANGSEGHLVSFQSALPKPTWTLHNQGVTPTKGSTDNYTESFGRAEQRFAVPISLTKRRGGAAMKSQQVRMAVLGMQQEVITQILYSNHGSNPERFHGLIPRLDSLSGPWQKQIVNHNAGASGNDQASILLIKPGVEDGVHLIYPPETTAGLDYKKLDDDYEDDGSGGKVLCERGHFIWNVGLAVEDARAIVRIGNVDMSALSGSSTSLIDAMIDAAEKFKSLAGCFWLMPRTVRAYLRKQKVNKNSPIDIRDIEGRKQVFFDECPIYGEDNMLLTESTIGA